MKSTILKNIVVVFLIVVLPLYLLSIKIITDEKNKMKNKLIQEAYLKNDLFIDSMTMEFTNISKLQNKLINDSDLINISKTITIQNYYESYKSFFNLQNKLNDINEISKYVTDAKIYLVNQGIVIDSVSVSQCNMEELNKIRNSISAQNNSFLYIDNKIFMIATPFYSKNGMNNSYSPKFIISIEISKPTIQSELKQYFYNKDEKAILIADLNGLNITEDIDNKIVKTIRTNIKNNINNDMINTIKVDKRNYIISCSKSSYLKSTLVVLITKENFFKSLNLYVNLIFVISILAIFGAIIFSVWIKGKIIKPINKLINDFDNIENEKFEIIIDYNHDDEFGDLYKKFNEMCFRLKDLIHEVYEQKLRVKEAEIKQLQYQINPHFLYNSFFLIYRMAKMHDEESVIKLTQHLGNYYQFITRSYNDDVKMIQEVNHAKDYTEIQSMRFSNRIIVEFEELPNEYENLLIPRLIIQPVIENAYKHGLKDKIEDGCICIKFNNNKNELDIIVEDNGNNLTDEMIDALSKKLSSKESSFEITGLINIDRRLKMRYGSTSGIFISRAEIGGLKVTEKIIFEGDNKNNV